MHKYFQYFMHCTKSHKIKNLNWTKCEYNILNMIKLGVAYSISDFFLNFVYRSAYSKWWVGRAGGAIMTSASSYEQFISYCLPVIYYVGSRIPAPEYEVCIHVPSITLVQHLANTAVLYVPRTAVRQTPAPWIHVLYARQGAKLQRLKPLHLASLHYGASDGRLMLWGVGLLHGC